MTLLESRDPTAAGRARATSSDGWFRAVWRWHFFASIIVIPVLLVLAVTGLTYLFRFQIDPLMTGDITRVEKPASATTMQPYVAQHAAVIQAHPGSTVESMTMATDTNNTVFKTITPEGASLEVFVNPWTGKVTGAFDPNEKISEYALRIHSQLMSGEIGEYFLEMGASWALVSALLGYYLWWKGRAARKRRRWSLRSWHARIGAIAGIGILTLLVSGLPWTPFWGGKVQEIATKNGSSLWGTDLGGESDPKATLDSKVSRAHEIPWALQKSKVPLSKLTQHPGDKRPVATVDTAIAVGAAQRLRPPMTIALPQDEFGVYSVMGYAFNSPSSERTVHVDRYSGKVVSTYGYQDYPLLAKAVAQGIGLHEGRSLGSFSFWAAAGMCLAVIGACLTGPWMWWRRKRGKKGTLAAPRGRMPVSGSRWLLAGLIALGLFLPLFGITLLICLLLDQMVIRRVPALSRWFSTV